VRGCELDLKSFLLCATGNIEIKPTRVEKSHAAGLDLCAGKDERKSRGADVMKNKSTLDCVIY
jgi:hypothetical protein